MSTASLGTRRTVRRAAEGRSRRAVAAMTAGTLLVGGFTLGAIPGGVAPAAADAPPTSEPSVNPVIADSCGVDVTLVLDASGSIQSSNAVSKVRNAAEAFLDSLRNTKSTARVTQFATVTQELAPFTLVDDAALAQGGDLRKAVDRYYNPKPPLGGIPAQEYRGGDVFSASSWRSGSSDQYTNWDRSLDQANDIPSELVVYITDGDPTAYDFQGGRDPFVAPTVGYKTDGSSQARTESINRAIGEANAVKGAGARMLAVGVGSALSNQDSTDRLVQISGTKVKRDADLATLTSLNDVDVALVTDFDKLAQFLRQVVLELCSPSLTIQKLAQSPASTAYEPAPGWDMTVTPTVPGGFRWILPDTSPAVSKSALTDSNGFAQFQWEPNPPATGPPPDSDALIVEALKPGYIPGRPGPNNDWSCELRDVNGTTRPFSGELTLGNDNASWALAPPEVNPSIGQEIVTCKVYNSYDYDSAIALTKGNTPTQVRGDLDDPTTPADESATVTSRYEVTNTGDSALKSIEVVDDKCAPASYVSGDVGGDKIMPPGLLPDGSANPAAETWVFECERAFNYPDSPKPTNVENIATVIGVDPTGQFVEATATDDVDIYTAGIEIEKTAAPIEVPRGVPATVVYTYTVRNTASLELADVEVVDDYVGRPRTINASCPNVTPLGPLPGPDQGGDTDGDNRLDPTETWTYSCSSDSNSPVPPAIDPFENPQSPLVNRATVEADPVYPDGTPAPPQVGDLDVAVVTVFDAGIDLVKTVGTQPDTCATTDEITVLPGTQVTYCYQVTNTGETDLRGIGQAPGPFTPDGWVEDDLGGGPGLGTCSPVGFDDGDVNGDGLLQRDEVWTYFCSKPINDDEVNTAVVSAESNTATPVPVTASDPARVDVVEPAIALDKVAERPVVLDPSAPAIAGPDVPNPPLVEPRPAVFTFVVTNPGDLPLADVSVSDTYPQSNACSPLPVLSGGFNIGDLNTPPNNLLDPGEAWQFECIHDDVANDRLTKADANPGSDPALPAPVTDTAIATGTPQLAGFTPEPIDSAPATQTVLVIKPGISLTKTASPEVLLAGDKVTYTFEVTNTGDVGLEPLALIDDKCSPIVYQSGDVGDDGILAGGTTPETWIYTCTRTIDQVLVDVNKAAVLATGPLGNLFEARAEATVRVIDPAIKLEKTVSDSLVPSGHGGRLRVPRHERRDEPAGSRRCAGRGHARGCGRAGAARVRSPTLVAKEGGNQDALLERVPAETWRYSCSSTITKPTTNVAIVGALGGGESGLSVPVFDFDVAYVGAFNPGIDVVKSAAPTVIFDSGQVTYTYTVKNTGDVPLAGVKDRITDNTCSPVKYVSGDEDSDGLLDTPNSIFEDSLDETWTFTCTTTVSTTTTNTVVTPGTPVDPGGEPLCRPTPVPVRGLQAAALPASCDVTDSAKAVVTVVKPASITIIKKTNPADGGGIPVHIRQ